jgi:hypothetical protein
VRTKNINHTADPAHSCCAPLFLSSSRHRAIESCRQWRLHRLRPSSPPPTGYPAAERHRPSPSPPPDDPGAVPSGASSHPPPHRRRLAPWPRVGPRRPSSSRRRAVAATSSPRRWAPPFPPYSFELSVGCGDGDVSIILPCLHQIVNEIRNDLSEFKCGMAHLFCMYINDVFLNDYAFFPFGSWSSCSSTFFWSQLEYKRLFSGHRLTVYYSFVKNWESATLINLVQDLESGAGLC